MCLIEKFKAAASRAVADGASVIVPGPAFLATLANRAGLTHVEDALVLDTVPVAVKTAEMLVGPELEESSCDRLEGLFSIR